MPRPIPAVVAPAVDVDRLSSDLHRLRVEHADAERAADAFDKKAAGSRERAREKALAMGQILIELRKAFPRSGPKAAGWGKLLVDQGIEERTARNWMALAGYVEISEPNANGSEIPSRREVQKARTPAPRVTREAVDEDPPDEGDDDDFDGEDGRTYSEPAPQHVTIHAQNVQIAASSPGSVVVQQALPARDVVGHALTPKAARVFQALPPALDRIAAHLREAAREWKAVTAALAEAGIQNATRPMWQEARSVDLDRLAKLMLDSKPHSICPSCNGKLDYCTSCGGAQWVRRDDWDRALPELKAAAGSVVS